MIVAEEDVELLNTRQFNWRRSPSSKATGLAALCDCAILEGVNNVIWNVNEENAVTFFINTRVFKQAFEALLAICSRLIQDGIIIIIGGEDFTFPNCIDKRYFSRKLSDDLIQRVLNLIKSNKVKKCYIENLDTPNLSNKIVAMPLGLNPKEGPPFLKYYEPFFSTSILDKPLKFTNFSRVRNGPQFSTRRELRNLCETKWSDFFVDCGTKNLDHISYLKLLSQFPFSICCTGGGLDVNPKLWECILLGVIPVVKKSPMTEMYINLPVILVDEWADDLFSNSNMEKWLQEKKNWFSTEKKRKELFSKLTLDHWYSNMKAGNEDFF
jgi:hypothetical protein